MKMASTTIDPSKYQGNSVTDFPSHQGTRGFFPIIVSKLVLKGIGWLGKKIFGGSRMGSSGNRGMNQMMSLKQDSVDVALGHMSKMRKEVSMSQNQAFISKKSDNIQ
jgi:hypothetical protein